MTTSVRIALTATLCLLPISVLLLSAGSASATDPAAYEATFDADLQGWTSIYCGTVEWDPAGFLKATQTADGAQQGELAIYSPYLGDLSAGIGQSLSLDLKVLEPSPVASPYYDFARVAMQGNGAEHQICAIQQKTTATPTNSWQTVSYPLVASSWTYDYPPEVVGQTVSEADFQAVLSSVGCLVVILEANSGSGAALETVGLDNVRFPGAPVPLVPIFEVTFDADLEGWTDIWYGSVEWNPAGFFEATQTSDPHPNGGFAIYSPHIGDVSGSLGGLLTIDISVLHPEPLSDPHSGFARVALQGYADDGSVRAFDLSTTAEPSNAWRTIEYPLDPPLWTYSYPPELRDQPVSEADLRSVLANLSFVCVVLEASDGAEPEVVGLDNVRFWGTTGNHAPVADAGEDRAVTVWESDRLDGSATDPDGDAITEYRWTVVSTPPGGQLILTDPYAPDTSYHATAPGTYELTLRASDGALWSAPSTLLVTATANQPPVAVISTDATSGTAPLTVSFDGSGSYDPEGMPLVYEWDFGDGSAADYGPAPLHTFTAPGIYTVELTVLVSSTEKASTTTTITALDPNNGRPVADAGPARKIRLGHTAGLLGSAWDQDGDPIVAWEWRVYSAPPGSVPTLSPADQADSTLYPDAEGTYVVQLRAADAGGYGDWAATTVEVLSALNLPPALSTRGLHVRFGQSCALDLLATDDLDDPEDLTYRWEQTGGPLATIHDPGARNPAVDVPQIVATLDFRVTVTDTEGAVSTAATFLTVTRRGVICVSSTYGSDGYPGTFAEPKGSLETAIGAARYLGSDVLVDAGAYHCAQTLVVPAGVSIYGGYAGHPDGRVWRRDATYPSEVLGAPTAVRLTSTLPDGTSAYTAFDGMTVRAAAASDHRADTPEVRGLDGMDSIALLVVNGTADLHIRNNTLQARAATSGLDGQQGASFGSEQVYFGVDGVSGEEGDHGETGGARLFQDPQTYGGWGGGTVSTIHGPVVPPPPYDDGAPGGRGGYGNGWFYSMSEGERGRDVPAAAGGAGGAAGRVTSTWPNSTTHEYDGDDGGNGRDGAPGAGGSSGTCGGDGGAGGGGGGGGGGDSLSNFLWDYFGSSGGGGGQGATGGHGGQGGGHGGRSIGILLTVDENRPGVGCDPFISSNHIVTADGGWGGAGAAGGDGGTGGAGGQGGEPGDWYGGGGDGGHGGHGGGGGGGGGGHGGDSCGIHMAYRSLARICGNTYQLGSAGGGGTGGAAGHGGIEEIDGEEGSNGASGERLEIGPRLADLTTTQNLVQQGSSTTTAVIIRPSYVIAHYAIAWSGSDVELVLVTPSGVRIDRSTFRPDVSRVTGPNYESVTVQDPEPGTWTVELVGHVVPPEGELTDFTFLPVLANSPPVADAGDDLVRGYAGPPGVAVALSGAGSADPDGDPLAFTWRDATGDVVALGSEAVFTLGVGEHRFTLTVDDSRGGTDSDEVRVVVEDPYPPVIRNVSASARRLWPPDHRMVPVTITGEIEDLVDPAPTLRIAGVSSNEPVEMKGTGNTAPDWRVTGPDTVLLRAERSGKGVGRWYRIEVVGVDAEGNVSAPLSVTVFVPHDEKDPDPLAGIGAEAHQAPEEEPPAAAAAGAGPGDGPPPDPGEEPGDPGEPVKGEPAEPPDPGGPAEPGKPASPNKPAADPGPGNGPPVPGTDAPASPPGPGLDAAGGSPALQPGEDGGAAPSGEPEEPDPKGTPPDGKAPVGGDGQGLEGEAPEGPGASKGGTEPAGKQKPAGPQGGAGGELPEK